MNDSSAIYEYVGMKRESMILLVALVVIVAVTAAIVGYRLSAMDETAVETSDTVIVPGQGAVCTMEAMQCPDGTYVGRTGPNCEFAACPTAPASIGEAGIGSSVAIAGYRFEPIEVVEDSRCPTDVQCIQAGTVRVRTKVGSDPNDPIYTFTLNVPQRVSGATFTLIQVSPSPISSREIQDRDYRFTFTVAP